MIFKFKLQYTTICKRFKIIRTNKIYFEIGFITFNSDKTEASFRVRSLKDLSIIINHFYNFHLLTSKRNDFHLFVLLYNMMCRKEHLIIPGFMKAITIISNINKPIKLV